jgi:hypothetical protein
VQDIDEGDEEPDVVVFCPECAERELGDGGVTGA